MVLNHRPKHGAHGAAKEPPTWCGERIGRVKRLAESITKGFSERDGLELIVKWQIGVSRLKKKRMEWAWG